MNKLSKKDKLFLIVLYVLFQLLEYYSEVLFIGIPKDPTKLRVKISTDSDNITHILTDVPCTASLTLSHNLSSMKENINNLDILKDTLNEYLNVILLPQNKELEPFVPSNPCSYNERMDSLYIYNVDYLNNGHYLIDAIYVDNMQAYRKVRADQNIKI